MKISSSLIKFILTALLLIAVFNYNKIIAIALLAAAALIGAYLKRDFYFFVKGNKLYNSGNIDQAFEYFEKAIKVRNASSRIKSAYAYLLLKNRNPEKSEKLLNSLQMDKLSIAERNQAILNLALVYWKQNKLDKALELLESVYNEFKCLTMYESYGYLLIVKGDYDRALKVNLEAYDYDNSSKVVLDNLGETYYHLKDFDKSYELYKNLTDNEPSFPEPYYHFALVLKEKEEIEKALQMLNKALEYKESYLSEVTHKLIKSAIDEVKQHQ